MTQDNSDINQILSTFGLTQKEQDIYLLLSKIGWSTASSISQKSPIKRTTIYRILESLQQKGLVETKLDDKSTLYQISDPKVFQSLLIESETKLSQMKSNLASLQFFLQHSSDNKPATSVHFYRGTKGVETIEWKLSQYKNTDIFIIGVSKWAQVISQDLAEKIRLEHLLNKNKIKEIHGLNASFTISPQGQTDWTHNSQYILSCYQHRLIDNKLLDLDNNNDLIITPNSIYLHSLQENEIVGIEIYSPSYASLMSQIFKILWNLSKSIDTFGGKNL